MKIKYISTVFKKELKDMSRDKRTIISTILIPMLIIPLLYYFMGSGMDSVNKNITENMKVSVIDTNVEIENFLKTEVLSGESIEFVNSQEPLEALKKDEVRLVLKIDNDYLNKLRNLEPFEIKMYYDSTKLTSSGSFEMIAQKIVEYNNKTALKRLETMGINPNIVTSASVVAEDLAPEETKNNQTLAMILPMLLAILLATAGAPAAIDLIVGERERKTFEPLLTTKADRFSILLGKYLSISVFSAISLVSSLIGVFIGMKMSPSMFGDNIGMSLSISILMLVLALFAIMLFGFMCSAIQMVLSAFAKTVKEGNTYISFLTFAIMIPAYATMFMQAGDVKSYMAFIPALNIIALIKTILAGIVDYNYLVMTLLSSFVYFGIIITVAFRLFKKESMVIR